jgi:hypothetical protein
MKKLFLLIALFTTVYATNANAQGGGQQGGGDPAAMMQKAKERLKPILIEKAKLTDVQADKVVEISVNSRAQLRGLRDLSEEDRKKRMDDVQASVDKQYKAIPLTDEQVKAVNAVMEEQRKEMQKQRQQQQQAGN